MCNLSTLPVALGSLPNAQRQCRTHLKCIVSILVARQPRPLSDACSSGPSRFNDQNVDHESPAQLPHVRGVTIERGIIANLKETFWCCRSKAEAIHRDARRHHHGTKLTELRGPEGGARCLTDSMPALLCHLGFTSNSESSRLEVMSAFAADMLCLCRLRMRWSTLTRPSLETQRFVLASCP